METITNIPRRHDDDWAHQAAEAKETTSKNATRITGTRSRNRKPAKLCRRDEETSCVLGFPSSPLRVGKSLRTHEKIGSVGKASPVPSRFFLIYLLHK